jgi:hypothetical protein
MEIDVSDIEAAVTDDAGLVNYHFLFSRVRRNSQDLIAVTGIPREKLDYFKQKTGDIAVPEADSEAVGQEI